MVRKRIIPSLLFCHGKLVKTLRFGKAKYLGDPVNIIKIFNDKEVDELILLDIAATVERRKPSFEQLAEIAGECFMPLCYGGGVCDLKDMERLYNIGMEKVAINSYAAIEPDFIKKASDLFGSQSVVVSMDVKRNYWGAYEVYTRGGRKRTGFKPAEFAVKMEGCGAGELLLNCINRDGTREGYDLLLVKSVCAAVRIPVIACGGAGSAADLIEVIKTAGASAAAAGSMFVFNGPHRAVLIHYPACEELRYSL